MPTVTLHRCSDPDALKRIGPQYLIELLSLYREFFQKRNFSLPTPDKKDTVDYEDLASIFITGEVRLAAGEVRKKFEIESVMGGEAFRRDRLSNSDQTMLTSIEERLGQTLSEVSMQTTIQESTKNFLENLGVVERGFKGENVLEEDKFSANPGGIDLTRKRLNLETQGQGVEFKLPFDPNNFENIPINGLTPIIFHVTTVTDFLLSFGLVEDPPETSSAVR